MICRRFCILICPPEGLYPVFTYIGVYDYDSDVNSGAGGNGLTKTDNRAFFSTMRLNGILTQTLGGLAMEYRFETVPTDTAGNPTGAWTPVLPAQVAETEIGHWEHFNPLPLPHMDTKKYIVSGPAGPNVKVATIAVDGWIQVPQENNAFTPAGAFASNGNMIELISQSLATFTAQDETGTIAGSAAEHPLAQDLSFGVRMRIRRVGKYRLGNRRRDVAELITHPCGHITNKLTVVFTAAHPNLDPNGVSIVMAGPGGPYNFTLPAIPEAGDWFGTATHTFLLSGLKHCAYLITLTAGVLLTNGDNVPGPMQDQIAFCT